MTGSRTDCDIPQQLDESLRRLKTDVHRELVQFHEIDWEPEWYERGGLRGRGPPSRQGAIHQFSLATSTR